MAVLARKKSYREPLPVETAQIQPKVLMLGANKLVRDDVRVLLGSMGYQCVVASTLKEALALLKQEKPDAAILDPQQADSPPARIVAAFYKMVPHLRGLAIVLLGEESDPELLQVLDAYFFPSVPRDALLQRLWPSLDSLLSRMTTTQQVTRSAPLVFDSFLQPSLAGTRSSHPTVRRLLYESDSLVADLSLEGQRDSQRVTLVGQILDAAKPEPHLSSVPVVLQNLAGLMGIAKSNEWGEFRFEFNFEPGVSLEIGARKNYWVSVGLPDSKSVMPWTTEESQIPETPGDSEAQKDVNPEEKKRR
jgi:DNA-binding NarL/FixJ family response regulator